MNPISLEKARSAPVSRTSRAHRRMQWLELKIPPLRVWLVLAGAMLGVARLTPRLSLTLAGSAAIALVALGAAVASAGVIAFRHNRTTVNPLTPSTSSAVVSDGVLKASA